MKLSKGMHIVIQSYKHNKHIHRIWKKSVVLEANNNYVVTANDRTKVIESDGRTWHSKEPAICVFFDDYWFNIIAMLKDDGIHYYCNLASPYVYDEEGIKYIDYDLDIKMYPSKRIRVLDRQEYEDHKIKMSYPKEVDDIIMYYMEMLKGKLQKHEFPFNDSEIKSYYQMYLNLKSY